MILISWFYIICLQDNISKGSMIIKNEIYRILFLVVIPVKTKIKLLFCDGHNNFSSYDTCLTTATMTTRISCSFFYHFSFFFLFSCFKIDIWSIKLLLRSKLIIKDENQNSF